MSQARAIWVFAEQCKEEIVDVSLEVLSKGREFADELSGEVNVVVIGENNERIVTLLSSYGADKVFFIDCSFLSGCSVEIYEDCLFRFFEEKPPGIILFGSTLFGNDLASRLMARMKTGLVSDCIDLSLSESGLLIQTKLTHGGKISNKIICSLSSPQIATVRPGAFAKKNSDPKPKIEVLTVNPQVAQRETRLKVKGTAKADPEKIGLDEAEVIVSAGRGIGSVENYKLIKELARSLNGAVGASLGAVDIGLVPGKNFIGQTGITVTPKLYVACGISGSIYHVLGMKDSNAIVAINKDRSAPIFKYSDIGLIGDAMDIVPALVKRLNEISEKEKNG